MSASALMNIGTQAISASYRQLQTTSNNIANANTEGYSRQTVQLQTAQEYLTGDGYIGRGVTVSTVSRAANTFLAQQTNALAAATGADAARADILNQLQQVFGKTDTGLGAAATNVFSAYSDLAAAPGDLSARQAVLGRLEDFASLARATSQGIADLQTQVQDDVKNSVAEVNGLAKSLAKLNVQIANATNSGHDPNDLLDQRDLLISHLSEQLEVHAVMGKDGQAALFVATGESLVLGNQANTVVATPDDLDPSRLNLGIRLDSGFTQLDRALTGEGRIAGLLRAQNDDLVAARNDLGQMVSAVSLSLNKQQGLGLDLSGKPGATLLHIEPPRVSAALSNAKDGTGHFLSSMSAEVTDAQALQASDYVIQADPAGSGSYTVTRQSDGLVRSGVASGDVVDGLRIMAGADTPAAGERFLLKGVGEAAGKLEVALRNPLGLAAANPVVATSAPGNVGTLSVAKLTITDAPAAPYAPLTVRFNDDAGAYDILDASGSTLTSGSFTAGQPIRYDGMAMTLAGLPRSGDRLLVAPTVHVSNSNGNALTLQGFGEQPLVAGQTAGDAFAATLSDMGVRTQSAAASASHTGAALSRAKAQLSGDTGVNLDEEAARLIQYQQGYQAAAKILQTAQSMLDTVIQLGR